MKDSPFRIAPLVAALAIVTPMAVGQAHAAATIINPAGTVAVGVNDEGHLNTSVGGVAVNTSGFTTGVAYKFPDGSFRDATAPGCFCEGWGVSVNGTASGYANVSTDFGANNLTVDSFASTATTATSIVHLTSLPGITVKQEYLPATNAPDVLFRNHVTITNTTGGAVSDVKYVRVMDWDVPPSEFQEFVTILGTATTTLLERSHNNGFNTANPLGGDSSLDASTEDVDFTDFFSVNSGGDHGAYFRFNFGSLADNESQEFDIFYGAAANQSDALAAIGLESIELLSLGQSSTFDNLGQPLVNDDGPTFIFGFAGVGGTPITVPEPGSLALLGAAFLGLAAIRRRRA